MAYIRNEMELRIDRSDSAKGKSKTSGERVWIDFASNSMFQAMYRPESAIQRKDFIPATRWQTAGCNRTALGTLRCSRLLKTKALLNTEGSIQVEPFVANAQLRNLCVSPLQQCY